MKGDRKVLVLTTVVILLIIWLIVLSLQTSQKSSKALREIENIRATSVQEPIHGRNGYTPVKNKDYFDGSNGANGNNGTNGHNAQPAKDGKDAPAPLTVQPVQAINGKSAYEIWLELGNVGSEQDFLDSLKGEAGPPARSAEFQCNAIKLQKEWRFIGDFIWKPLEKVSACGS